MILIRDVFEAKYGKGAELVALFREFGGQLPENVRPRILTDLSGTFFTVVHEMEVANLAEWERLSAEVFASADFGEWFGRMMPLTESGRREFYTIET